MLLSRSGWCEQEQVALAAACHISLLSMKNRICNSINATNAIENTYTNTNTNTQTNTYANTKKKNTSLLSMSI